MNEGRRTQVIFLNGSNLEIFVKAILTVAELLEYVASKFGIRELEYFGLAFIDETHYSWLQLDRRVLDHEFPQRASGQLVLQFLIRFYAESITMCKYSESVELFYRQARLAIYQERTCCNKETVSQLAALVLQETLGNYTDDDSARKNILRLRVLPASLLNAKHSSAEYSKLENCVIEEYKRLKGLSRGTTIVNYMRLVESLPTYGVHYYDVKDKSGNACWLGISGCGVSVFESENRFIPKHVFRWQQLENLYFREKKFSIEVHDQKRVVHTLSSFNLYDDTEREMGVEATDDLSDAISDPTTQMSVSRRTFGAGSVKMYAWMSASTQLTKTIWAMAVSQHQFYLDRIHKKILHRTPSEVALDLNNISNGSTGSGNRSGARLPRSQSTTLLSDCYTAQPLPACPIGGSLKRGATLQGMNYYKSLGTKLTQKEALSALSDKKKALEEKLQMRLEKLQELCLQESDITGRMPVEYRMFFGDAAKENCAVTPSALRRRNSESVTNNSTTTLHRQYDGNKESGELAQLRAEYEVQDKIVKAALNLTKDNNMSHSVRKQRLAYYERELTKLMEMERRLNIYQSSLRGRRVDNSLSASSSSSSLSSNNKPFSLGMPGREACTQPSNTTMNNNRFYDNLVVQVDDAMGLNSRRNRTRKQDEAKTRLSRPVPHSQAIKSAPASPISVGSELYRPPRGFELKHPDTIDGPSGRISSRYRESQPGINSGDQTFQPIRPPSHYSPSTSSSASSSRKLPGLNPQNSLPGIPAGFPLDISGGFPTKHKSYDMLDRAENVLNVNFPSSAQYKPPQYPHGVHSNGASRGKIEYDRIVSDVPQSNGFQFYNNKAETQRSADEPPNSRLNADGAKFFRTFDALNIDQSNSPPWNSPRQMLLLSSPEEQNLKRNVKSSTPVNQMSTVENRGSSQQLNYSPSFFSPPALPLNMYSDGVDLSLMEHPNSTGSIDRATSRTYPESMAYSPRTTFEVSKPFEMSDFYKYSERFRTHQNHELPDTMDVTRVLPQPRSVSAVSGNYEHNLHDNTAEKSYSGRQSASAGKFFGSGNIRKRMDGGAQNYGVTNLLRGHSIEASGSTTRRLLPNSFISPPELARERSLVMKQLTPGESNRSINDASFGSFEAHTGLARKFEEEMLAWYESSRRSDQVGGAPGARIPRLQRLTNGSEAIADDEQATLV